MADSLASDIETILAKRHDNGGDHWSTDDGRVYVGNPFSTLSSLAILHELGIDASHEAVAGALELVLGCWRDDGKIRLGPKAPLYPCYTAEAARVLCRYGYAEDPRLERTVQYFLEEAHESGGWRCHFTRFGRGPETEVANPGATLFVLDALRFTAARESGGEVVEGAVESLLAHWETRAPCGPCHYGIGKKFLQVEYPFLRYNLFYWIYVLSFYASAHDDPRFRDAFELLTGKLDDDEHMVVEQPHRGLKGLDFCRRGQPSDRATERYREIVANLE